MEEKGGKTDRGRRENLKGKWQLSGDRIIGDETGQRTN